MGDGTTVLWNEVLVMWIFYRKLLADRIAWQYDGTILSSICLSVMFCIVVLALALRVGVGVESCTIMFLGGHFLFISSDIFAVGCIV